MHSGNTMWWQKMKVTLVWPFLQVLAKANCCCFQSIEHKISTWWQVGSRSLTFSSENHHEINILTMKVWLRRSSGTSRTREGHELSIVRFVPSKLIKIVDEEMMAAWLTLQREKRFALGRSRKWLFISKKCWKKLSTLWSIKFRVFWTRLTNLKKHGIVV